MTYVFMRQLVFVAAEGNEPQQHNVIRWSMRGDRTHLLSNAVL